MTESDLDLDLALDSFRDHAPPPAPDAADRVVASILDGSSARPLPRHAPGSVRRLWSSRRRSALACAACLLAGGTLTSPGRAAIDHAGALTGIGEKPSKSSPGTFTATNTPLVVANGEAPDKTRYEWVASRAEDKGTDVGFCLAFDWPGVATRKHTAMCDPHQRTSTFITTGTTLLPRQHADGRRRDLMLRGTTGPKVHDLRIAYEDARGRRRTLPVDFARVEGALLERVGATKPFGVFTAFLSSDAIARDRLVGRRSVQDLIIPYTRRDLPKGCFPRHTRYGPFELIAYDASGRALERMRPSAIPTTPAGCPKLVTSGK